MKKMRFNPVLMDVAYLKLLIFLIMFTDFDVGLMSHLWNLDKVGHNFLSHFVLHDQDGQLGRRRVRRLNKSLRVRLVFRRRRLQNGALTFPGIVDVEKFGLRNCLFFVQRISKARLRVLLVLWL